MTAGGFSHVVCLLSALTYAVVTPASIDTTMGRDAATARVISSIVSYTRWPDRPAQVHLCVVGQANHADQFSTIAAPGGPLVTLERVTPSRASASDCNILYLGQLSPAILREQVDWARGRAVLTIAESDPECRSQVMFCLHYAERALTFDLNVDAVSRSGLRIDPRVLRLASGGPS